MHERETWIYFPVGLNIYWLVCVVFFGEQTLSDYSSARLALAIFASTTAVVGILGFVVNDIGPKKAFLVMSAQTLALICLFAHIYAHGMADKITNFGEGLYYSVVNWTARGHATVEPHDDMLIVTAIQSFTGYIFLGLLVSILASVVNKPKVAQQ